MSMAKPRSRADRRRRVLMSSVAVMIIIIGGFITSTAAIHTGHPRAVDLVRTGGFVLWSLVIALRATTAFTFLKRDPTLDDELTRANRASAARAGFWAMMIGVWLALAGALYTDLTVLAVAPLLVAMGAAGAALRFSLLEARGDEAE
jgi:hypothetical protein